MTRWVVRLRAGVLALALTASSATVLGANATPACAAERPSAALVVDTGPDTYRLCVALPDDEVTGIGLIELAAEQHDLSYRLGFGDKGVCMLAGVGPSSTDCFADYPYFWGYWHGAGSGGWSWAGSGAAAALVSDGDVEGWSWGRGNDPASHPPPPLTAFGAVCAAPTPSPTPSPSAGETPREADLPEEPAPSTEAGSGAGPDPSPVTGSDKAETTSKGEGQGAPRAPRSEGSRASPSEGGPEQVPPRGLLEAAVDAGLPARATSSASSDERSGPPGAGLAGLAAAVSLGLGGVWLRRRVAARARPGRP